MKIEHEELPEQECFEIEEHQLCDLATKHLLDLGVNFKDVNTDGVNIKKDPKQKHSEQVTKKQQAVVNLLTNGYKNCKSIASTLKLKEGLVYFTVKWYKATGHIVPYENYQCNKVDKVSLIKNFFKENPDAAFSNYRLWESIGFIIAFVYQGYLCVYVKLYILIGMILLSGVTFLLCENYENKRNKVK